MLDVVDDRGGVALDLRGDAPGHLIRRHARILEGHADDRDADVREDVRRHALLQRRAENDQQAEYRQQQRKDNEGVGAPQRHLDNPHSWSPDEGVCCRLSIILAEATTFLKGDETRLRLII